MKINMPLICTIISTVCAAWLAYNKEYTVAIWAINAALWAFCCYWSELRAKKLESMLIRAINTTEDWRKITETKVN